MNNQPNDNGPNSKMKSIYNVTKSAWIMNYGTTKFSPHHMNFVLVEAWDDFRMSYGNTIRQIFATKKLLPLRPPNLTTNTQVCAASIQVSSGAKAEEINNISLHIVAPIELHFTRTDATMVVL